MSLFFVYLNNMLIRQILLQKFNCNRLKYIYIYYNINIEIKKNTKGGGDYDEIINNVQTC